MNLRFLGQSNEIELLDESKRALFENERSTIYSEQ